MIGFEQFDAYRDAAQRATVLAGTFTTPVQVVRSPSGSGWLVQQPWNYRRELDPQASQRESPSTVDDGQCEFVPKEIQQEIDRERQELSEEMDQLRENWARADEDGWFYPDY